MKIKDNEVADLANWIDEQLEYLSRDNATTATSQTLFKGRFENGRPFEVSISVETDEDDMIETPEIWSK